MNGLVRTVRGDVAPGELGTVNSHDHLFFRSAALAGQELDDRDGAERQLREFAADGGRTLVQWTPHGLGRGASELAGLSRAGGVHVVAATGMHRTAHYPPGFADARYDGLADLFVAELTGGIRDTGTRAGMIKVAGDFHGISAHTRRTMAAAADAHHRTGAPIGVHLEHGSAALLVLRLLCDEHGVPPQRVILGHLNRYPDLGSQRAAAASGAFLCFDGPSLANHATDAHMITSLRALHADGHGDQLLLGADTTTAAARGNPGPGWLLNQLRPRLDPDLDHRIFVDNPARAFVWRFV